MLSFVFFFRFRLSLINEHLNTSQERQTKPQQPKPNQASQQKQHKFINVCTCIQQLYREMIQMVYNFDL